MRNTIGIKEFPRPDDHDQMTMMMMMNVRQSNRIWIQNAGLRINSFGKLVTSCRTSDERNGFVALLFFFAAQLWQLTIEYSAIRLQD